MGLRPISFPKLESESTPMKQLATDMALYGCTAAVTDDKNTADNLAM